MSILTAYLGHDAFERAGLAFAALGYEPPRPDTNSEGAYVSNIVAQYQSDLTDRQAIAIVRFGLAHSKQHLAALATWGPKPTLAELVDQYQPTEGEQR